MPAPILSTTRIATIGDLEHYAASWNCLTKGVPFRGFEWLSTWWEHYQKGRELFAIAVHDDAKQLLGVLPLYRENNTAQGRVLRLLGSGEVCSDYLTVLTTNEHEDVVIDAIAGHLLAACHRDASEDDLWDLLELDGVNNADPAIAKLVAALSESGCGIHRKLGMNCWKLPLPSSWDELYGSLSKNRRKALRRLQRDAFDNGNVVFQTARTHDEFDKAMEVFVDLHQKRRISLGEPGCFASKPFADFISSVSPKLWAAGALELVWIELDNRPLAIEYNLLGSDTTYSFQGGLDPDSIEASPGHLLTMASIRNSIERGRNTYDFLRGDEPYKSHWNAEPQPAVTLRIAANRASAQLRQGVWLAGTTMKNWVKGGLTLTGMQ